MSSTLGVSARRKPKRKPKDKKHGGKKHQPAKPKKPKKPTKPKPKPKPPATPTPPTPTTTPTTTPSIDPYAPGSYPATPVLPVAARHLANRFTYGITPGVADEVRAAGSPEEWFDHQLESVPDAASEEWVDWWPDLHLDAPTIYQRGKDLVRSISSVGGDAARRTMVRRISSPTQVLEVMTEFWENHFHVPATTDNIGVYRGPYGEAIRLNALGRFADLLPAAVLNPAMLMYLGNVSSTKTHPNENLGRELLELHTLGVGNHTEDDVKNAARILTGYRAKTYSTWEAYYSTNDHWTGTVTVQGFTDPNTAADGRDTTMRFLSYLAKHPATARRIATKLAKQFVSDTPPTTLIDNLAAVYLANDTQIKPVLRALVRSKEFAAAVDLKVRDADEDVAATYRLLGAVPTAPVDSNSPAVYVYSQVSALGLAPFGWPRPDGQPIDNKAWISPTRALASMSMHWNMAGGAWPNSGLAWKPVLDFLPAERLSFRDFIDHLSRVVLQRPSSAALLELCCAATGSTPTTEVTAASKLLGSGRRALFAAILDSPDFYQH